MYNTAIVAFADEVKHQFDVYLREVALFKINNKALRDTIQYELQEWVNILAEDVPELFSCVTVICDEVNNPPDIINRNQLCVNVIFNHAINNASMLMKIIV